MSAEKHRVHLQRDHLEKVASGSPERALAELIWNALDADATSITVLFNHGNLGVEEVIVRDNGSGFDRGEAPDLFGSLGGSWKQQNRSTEKGRQMHGQEGEGRFKAFALGRIVEWNVTRARAPAQRFSILCRADDMDEFELQDLDPDPAAPTGVMVRISELTRQFELFQSGIAATKLLPMLALYLKSYSDIAIVVGGVRLDPAAHITRSTTLDLGTVVVEGTEHPVALEIVEWKNGSDKELWYCSDDGFPIERYPKQIRGVGDFAFTAYLRSRASSVLQAKQQLGLGELTREVRQLADNAVKALKTHFAKRALEEGQAQIRKWKAEMVYPFGEEPTNAVETAERQVFDIVAVRLSESLPSLDASDTQSKAFQLRMLRQAVENSPEDLRKIITDVLNLPQAAREQLAELLEDVSLAALISVSKLVTDRMRFIAGLEAMLYDEEAKELLQERTQLHRILAENTWLFGHEFSLSVDDQSLTEVLRRHLKLANLDAVIDEPVTRLDGRTGIVDLMLSRAIPTSRGDEIEHLVVELKRPKQKIRQAECNQITDYAYAVTEDERFAGLKARWTFWVISNDMDQYTIRQTSQEGRPRGVLTRDNDKADLTIWVKTWSQIIQENKHRLQFLKDKLEFSADRQAGIQHLKKVYAQFTAGIFEATDHEAA